MIYRAINHVYNFRHIFVPRRPTLRVRSDGAVSDGVSISNMLKKGSPYSITERRDPGLIPLLGSRPAGDVSHKPGGLPKTVTRQRRDCDLNPGPSAPESSTLTTRLPSQPATFGKCELCHLSTTMTQ